MLSYAASGQITSSTEFFILDTSEACQGEGLVELSGVLASDTSVPLEPGGRFEIENCNNSPCHEAILFDSITQNYFIDIAAPEDSYLIAYIVGSGPFEKKYIAQFDIQAANSQIVTLDDEVCKNNLIPLQANPNGGVLVGEGLDSIVLNGITSYFFNSRNLIPDSTYRINYFYQLTTASGLVCGDSSYTDIFVRDSLGITVEVDSLGYCKGDEINLLANPIGDISGLSVTWYNSEFDSISNLLVLNTDTISVSETYFVQGTNNNGCADLSEFSIKIVEPPLIQCVTLREVDCSGSNTGQIAVISELLSIEEYTINWPDGNTNATRDSLPAGIYTVSITDNIGCQSICSVELTEPERLEVTCTQNIMEPQCWNGNDGTNDINIIGGTAPYLISLDSTNFTSESKLTGLGEGEYTVFVIDSKSCMAKCNFIIDQPDEEVCNIACLLYTSPSPRDRTRSRMPSSA